MPGFLTRILSLKGSKHDRDTVPGCTFCNIAGSPDKFEIVWQDDTFIAFEDHKPAARRHLLVAPKKHVASVRSLTKADVPFVEAMQKVGTDLLDKYNVPADERRMGFHIPPFNSIDHLHMHVHALPYKSTERAVKYAVVGGFGLYHKGLVWFADVGQAIRILESGRRVGVLPC